MRKRSLFKKVFGSDKNNQFGTRLVLLNNYNATWTKYNGRNYDNITIRSCIDTIARNGAKLSPKHIRKTINKFESLNQSIQRIISEQPNELMNAYDFYYKVISLLYLDEDVFIYVMRDENGYLTGLYPINSNQVDLLEYDDEIFVEFKFGTGKKRTVAYKDIIHLRRHFCQNDIFGGSNKPIIEALSFQHILKEGIVNAIKTTMGIKGILKSTKAMLKPEDIKKNRDQFVKDFIENEENGTGIAGLDASTDFKEININPMIATDSQMTECRNDILNYFNLNENIIKSKYTEEEWNAFYESVLEPIALQMSLEFTNKIFTLGEKYHGNKIFFESNRLQYASNKTKIEVARYMNNYLTKNEIREIFNYAPVSDGDVFMQDLNHIDGSIANSYQGGDKNE